MSLRKTLEYYFNPGNWLSAIASAIIDVDSPAQRDQNIQRLAVMMGAIPVAALALDSLLRFSTPALEYEEKGFTIDPKEKELYQKMLALRAQREREQEKKTAHVKQADGFWNLALRLNQMLWERPFQTLAALALPPLGTAYLGRKLLLPLRARYIGSKTSLKEKEYVKELNDLVTLINHINKGMFTVEDIYNLSPEKQHQLKQYLKAVGFTDKELKWIWPDKGRTKEGGIKKEAQIPIISSMIAFGTFLLLAPAIYKLLSLTNSWSRITMENPVSAARRAIEKVEAEQAPQYKVKSNISDLIFYRQLQNELLQDLWEAQSKHDDLKLQFSPKSTKEKTNKGSRKKSEQPKETDQTSDVKVTRRRGATIITR